MPTIRSFFWTSALLCLSFSDARVTNHQIERRPKNANVVADQILHLNPFAKRQSSSPSSTSAPPCVDDGYVDWLEGNTIGPQFCADLMSSPTATQTVYTTPTTTITDVESTSTIVRTQYPAAISTITTTITEPYYVVQKRAPAATSPAILPRAADSAAIEAAVQYYMADFDDSSAASASPSIFQSLSSACSCIDFGPFYTSNATVTPYVATQTVPAFVDEVVTISSTRVVQTQTSTVIVYNTTVTTSPITAVATTTVPVTTLSSASSTATAIAPPIVCPAAQYSNQTVVTGDEAWSYYVFCNESFSETPFVTVVLSSFRDCLDLCSVVSSENPSSSPTCKGVSFDGSNCYLYNPANEGDLFASSTMDSAILFMEVSQTNQTVTIESSGSTTITMPATVSGSTYSFSSCSGTTTTYSNGGYSFTDTCTSNSSWWTEYVEAQTTIYMATTIIRGFPGITAAAANGSSATGGVASPASSAAVATSATASATTLVSSGATGGASTTGGIVSVAYITTIVSGQTIVAASTIFINGSGSGSSATGSVFTPYTTTIVANGSTIVETYSTNFSGLITTGSATGGVFSPTTYSYNTTITTGTIIINGTTIFETSIFTTGSATGGYSSPITIPSENVTTITSGTTTETTEVYTTSTTNSTGSGTGAVVLPSTTLQVTSSNVGIITTIINGSTVATTETFITNGSTGAGTGTGSVFTPSNSVNSSSPSSPATETTVNEGRVGTFTTLVTTSSNGSTWVETETFTTTYGNYSSSGTGVVSIPTYPAVTTAPPANTTSPTSAPFSSSLTNQGRSGSQSPPYTYNHTYSYNHTNSNYSSHYHTRPSSASSTIPTPSANSSSTFSASTSNQGRSGSQSPPASTPTNTTTPTIPTYSPPSSNYTVPTTANTTSAPPSSVTPTLNITSSIPPAISNSSACVTMTSVSISTVTVTQIPSTCFCGTTGFPTYSAFPTYGYLPYSPPASSPASSSPSSTTSTVAYTSVNQLRAEGQPASDEQIAFACSNIGNQIFNGGFELLDTNDASEAQGWSFIADESTSIMYFADVAVATDQQKTPNGTQLGRVVTEDATASGRLYQPLTLCPNTTYQFGVWTQQASQLSECVAVFEIATTTIGTVEPPMYWTNSIYNPVNYTVGPNSQDGAVDLSIIASCQGGSVSASSPGSIDFDEVSLMAVLS